MVRLIRFRLKAGPALPEDPQATRFRISGSMSANAIARRYPRTDVLFRRFQIDLESEGYESVEELAWRHGMDTIELLNQLRKTALRSRRPEGYVKPWDP